MEDARPSFRGKGGCFNERLFRPGGRVVAGVGNDRGYALGDKPEDVVAFVRIGFA